MRIAIVETSAFGGLLHYAVQLGDGLASRGHDVDLLVPRGNELSDHEGPARMRAVLAAPSKPGDALPSNRVRRFIKRAGVAIRLTAAWLRIQREARSGRYDIVVVNADTELSIPAFGVLALLALPGGPKMVEIAHNTQTVDRSGRARGPITSSPLQTRLTRAQRARFDLVLVHGDRSEAALVESWPFRRVAQIPHGDERIFSEDPPAPSSEERILLFGTLNRVKGIPLLMEAFDMLCERRPTVRLTIAGMPHEHEVDIGAIRAWADRHGDSVELIDRYIEIGEVREIFARARVVVTPYVVGYQSGVVHLAMTMARPVVTTDVGDLASVVVDGKTGSVVETGDPVALADALERVLDDPDLAARLGAAGYESMRGDSSWEAVAEQAELALVPLMDD